MKILPDTNIILDYALIRQPFEALKKHHKDFEDDIQYYSAVFNNLDAIVTRNSNDFPVNSLRILTPEQLLQEFSDSSEANAR